MTTRPRPSRSITDLLLVGGMWGSLALLITGFAGITALACFDQFRSGLMACAIGTVVVAIITAHLLIAVDTRRADRAAHLAFAHSADHH